MRNRGLSLFIQTKMEAAWYAEFLLEINGKILLRKTAVRLKFNITLINLHID
jgi:hypothetical protein